MRPRAFPLRPASVEKMLDEGRVRPFRGVVDRRHDPVASAGKRGEHHEAVGREEQRHLVAHHRIVEHDVGEDEGPLVGRPLERNAAAFPHDAAGAVGADDIARLHFGGLAADLHAGGDMVARLLEPDQARAARDRDAKRGKAVEQDRLGPVLRQHQQVAVVGRQRVEPDQAQQPVAVAEGELLDLPALGDQAVRDADPVEDFQRMGMYHGGARRGLGRFGALDQQRAHAALRQRHGDRKPHRTGADDKDITGIGQHRSILSRNIRAPSGRRAAQPRPRLIQQLVDFNKR